MSASLFDPTTEETAAEGLTPETPNQPSPRTKRVGAVLRAGGRTSAWLLGIILLVAVVLWQRVIYIVPAGGAGVMWQLFFGGTVTDHVFGEGLHIKFPWDRFTIYDTRRQSVDSDFTVLTNKGLPIALKLTIRYHPDFDTVALLDQRVGKDYVSKIVKPTVESVLRRYIGREDPEAIYSNKEGVLSSIISRAIEETSEQFVSIDDVIIRQVALPDAMKDAISTKLIYQQQAQGYEFRLEGERKEAERKIIEATAIRDANEIMRQGLTPELLRWEAIKVEGELAKSNNSKLIIMNGADHRQININAP